MYTVSLNGQEFTSTPNETLLESAEKAGKSIYSECRDGFCGACKCKLKSGSTKEIRKTMAYIPDDYVLACSVKAQSDLVIELD